PMCVAIELGLDRVSGRSVRRRARIGRGLDRVRGRFQTTGTANQVGARSGQRQSVRRGAKRRRTGTAKGKGMAEGIERALVVTAHPDDAEFGAAGTIAKLVGDGCEVAYVIVTNGNKGSRDRTMTPQ